MSLGGPLILRLPLTCPDSCSYLHHIPPQSLALTQSHALAQTHSLAYAPSLNLALTLTYSSTFTPALTHAYAQLTLSLELDHACSKCHLICCVCMRLPLVADCMRRCTLHVCTSSGVTMMHTHNHRIMCCQAAEPIICAVFHPCAHALITVTATDAFLSYSCTHLCQMFLWRQTIPQLTHTPFLQDVLSVSCSTCIVQARARPVPVSLPSHTDGVHHTATNISVTAEELHEAIVCGHGYQPRSPKVLFLSGLAKQNKKNSVSAGKKTVVFVFTA